MITAIYEGIFVVKPVVDLRNHEMAEHGISVIGGGPKATLFFVLGYTAFYFSYYLDHRRFMYKNDAVLTAQKGNDVLRENTIIKNRLPWLYVMWAITFFLCIYCMLTQGLSLRYIFSFGTDGIREVNENNTALLFLANFGITLVTLWLMIMEFSRNFGIKVFTTVLCIIYILMRNARWLMLVFIVSPVTLFYLKRKRQPRLLWVVIIAVTGLFVFAWMQSNRATLAAGGAMEGWGSDGFTLEKLIAPLESDLSTYRTFYSMVERYPSQYEFVLGSTFAYVFVLFIPRALWHGKPDNPVRSIIEHSLNKSARASGTAVSNIGEFYANFGLPGIIFFMYMIGWITASIKRTIFHPIMRQKVDIDKYIAYSIFFPLLFQWIARGNFSGNVYVTIFALLPFIIFHLVERQTEGKGL